MRAVTLSNAKKNLRTLIRAVCENSEPAVIVDKESTEQAVLVSLEDYRSLEEMAYLLRSPANRAHLEEALQQVREEKTIRQFHSLPRIYEHPVYTGRMERF